MPKNKSTTKSEYHLKVFSDRSELDLGKGKLEKFEEGRPSKEAVKRYTGIRAKFCDGFLTKAIDKCRNEPHKLDWSKLSRDHQESLRNLVSSVTSEVGRGIVGLTVLQLAVKTINRSQSIRLHKGGSGDFSWVEGISMRTLDRDFVTPALRSAGLLNLNRDGFMMTRSLAENYPYSRVYKAAIRGAKNDWATVLDGIEFGTLPAKQGLEFLLSQLINNANAFEKLSKNVTELAKELVKLKKFKTSTDVLNLLLSHVAASDYKARVFEVLIHAFMQALEDLGALNGGNVKPLSQMRSANKKHGNIGDVEVLDRNSIIESWDAKYGKPYLRDELEELNDKLIAHSDVLKAGFVCSETPDQSDEIVERTKEISELNRVEIEMLSIQDWVQKGELRAISSGVKPNELAISWLLAYIESLTQKRRTRAPIDEPCHQWLASLVPLLT